MTIDERIERLLVAVEAHDRQISENSRQIADNYRQIAENSRQISENSRQISDLRASMSEIREGQALLVQILAQEQEALREFRRTTNATLDRIDRTLDSLFKPTGKW